MSEKSKHWTREQLLVAFNLYCQLPFGKFHSRNPDIIRIAALIDRTPSALAMKLVNIASLDPFITDSGRTGLKGVSKLDRTMWSEMQNDWSAFAFQSQSMVNSLLEKNKLTLESLTTTQNGTADDVLSYSAETKIAQTKIRIGQNFFRRSVLSAYSGRCCITGLSHPSLLVASHIVPWQADKDNRLNPRNGLCLSVFHDKAFDQGLITITHDYSVRVASSAKSMQKNQFASEWLLGLNGKKISLPEKFIPSEEFITWHNEHVFLAN